MKLLAALLAVLVPAAALAATPEQAVVRVLTDMRSALRYKPDLPSPRGPHEWNARQVLKAGTVNGCVESAKAFFVLFRKECPDCAEAYLDAFNAVGAGGHSAVAVTGADGQEFIVDAAAFERLPGSSVLTDEDLKAPVDVPPERRGRVVQFPPKSDLFLEKRGRSSYRMTVYPYGRVFDAKPLSVVNARNLAELNRKFAEYAAQSPVDFAWLRDHGLILPYADAEKTGFIYPTPDGGQSLHVIYGRFKQLPEVDEAEALEPAARRHRVR